MTLLDRLTAHARAACEGRGPAHDFLHVRRVAALARTLAEAEGARVEVVVAAALLHELVNLPKSHPESHRSGDLCAEEAERLLLRESASGDETTSIVACIRDHAFSKGARPSSLEAAVLQDADRLDAIGAIGVARCFATCTEMQRPFYADDDPFCRAREPDDKSFGLDHFYKKLLRIEDGLHTATARALGRERAAFLRAYLAQLATELR